jgi:hypothetical protein
MVSQKEACVSCLHSIVDCSGPLQKLELQDGLRSAEGGGWGYWKRIQSSSKAIMVVLLLVLQPLLLSLPASRSIASRSPFSPFAGNYFGSASC